MQRIRDAVSAVAGFDTLPPADKLRFFAWAMHANGKEHLKPADFTACFEAVHLPPPGNIHRDLKALEGGDLLKSSQGLRLSKQHRDVHDAKYGNRPQTVQVHEILTKLVLSVSSADRREYLEEALRCFRACAWRGAVIMSWNAAFDHLCEHIVSKKLKEFNAGWAAAFPSPKKAATFTHRSDLQDVKESEVIKACRSGTITDGTQHKCLERNLGLRNDAAHPSGAKFNQLQAESFISEVVQTIVLGI